ncbi:MAG: Fic family protein [Rickettsiales bacterium]|nr:Fic family protein [Rickettsiales bacterium]
MNYINQAFELKKQLDNLRPISPALELKIHQKFRLDWNFHSNSIEGNSLSFGETRMLLLHGITASGKPLKDHFEITGHNQAIKLVEEVVKSDKAITENFIRELHALILKESYEIDAITPEGTPTKKLIKVGEYKTSPNHVLTKTGEIFYFAEPFETPAKMMDLITWYKKESESEEVNPIILAAEFHYKFILIHPFDDGNGRIARILMNFILMKFGFPPVIIKTQDKENYITSLRQADGGLIENFIEYVAKNLVHCLEIMIKGARGENIEESDDLDKKLELLKFNFKNSKPNLVRSKSIISEVYNKNIKRLLDKFFTSCQKFDDFYLSKNVIIFVKTENNALPETIETYKKLPAFLDSSENIVENIEVSYFHNNLLNQQNTDCSFFNKIEVIFYPDKYSFKFYPHKAEISKNYDEFFTEEEIDEIIKIQKETHYKIIEYTLHTKI